MTICERMFDLIEKTDGKSAAGLCRVLDIGTGQTTSWKQRNTDPPAKYLAQICEYLNVSLEYLVTGKERHAGTVEVTSDEVWLLEKYRALDEDGIVAVRGAILEEYRRVNGRGEGKEKAG